MKKLLPIILLFAACNSKKDKQSEEMTYKTIGSIERLDPSLDSIISADAEAEIIAEGFKWSEGPLWLEHDSVLLFSDVPDNIIYKWTEREGKTIYLQPAGFTGTSTQSKEQGSNGLVLDHEGRLVICQHGDRRMARMDAPLNAPAAKFITLADKHAGKRFSSPNDAVYYFDELYFTDPPYGLPTQSDDDSTKEIPFNGVYMVNTAGVVRVVDDSLTRPNGLAFFPGNKQLLVANCDSNDPTWYQYDLNSSDSLRSRKVFFSVKGYDQKLQGQPDGLKIDARGNVYATGPGGVYIINSEGKLLGKIKLDNPASNCALSGDEKTLYITNHMYVLRVKLRK